jgi:NitT/TauT family transport system substrate-binding protein
MSITRRDALALGTAAATSAMLPLPAVAQATEVTLAFGPPTPVYALGLIADAKGFFASEKLLLRTLIGNAGTHNRQTLAAGQSLFAHGDSSHPLQLSTRGKRCKILLATQMVCSYVNVVVRKDLVTRGVNSVEKLAEYKRPNGDKPVVGVTAIGAGTWIYGTYLFESKGFKDRINWVSAGGARTMLPGLETRQFDAIITPPSWKIEMQKRGIGEAVFDPSQPGVFNSAFGGTIPLLVIYTLEDTIKERPGLVQSFVNGLYQAMKWVKGTSLNEVYALVAEKHYSGQDADAINEELGFDRNTWAYDGRIDEASYARGSEVWDRPGVEIPKTAYADIIDMSFLDAAQKRFG